MAQGYFSFGEVWNVSRLHCDCNVKRAGGTCKLPIVVVTVFCAFGGQNNPDISIETEVRESEVDS
jgi:hypothetical protein